MRLVRKLSGAYECVENDGSVRYRIEPTRPRKKGKRIGYTVLKNGKFLTGAFNLENAKARVKEFLSYDGMPDEEKRKIANQAHPETYRIVETDETLLENRDAFRGTYYDCFLHCRDSLYPKLEDRAHGRLFIALWGTRRRMFSDYWFMEFETYGLFECRTLKRYKVEKV